IAYSSGAGGWGGQGLPPRSQDTVAAPLPAAAAVTDGARTGARQGGGEARPTWTVVEPDAFTAAWSCVHIEAVIVFGPDAPAGIVTFQLLVADPPGGTTEAMGPR